MAIALITAMVVNQIYGGGYSAPVKMIAWFGVLVALAAIALTTTQGEQLMRFSGEAQKEMKQVVWPTRQETVQSTIMVVIMVLLVSMFLWVADTGIVFLIGKILGN